MTVRQNLLVTVLTILFSGATYGGSITYTVGVPTGAGTVEILPALLRGGVLTPPIGAVQIGMYDITKNDLKNKPQTALFNGMVANLKLDTGGKGTYKDINLQSNAQKFEITLSNLKVAKFDGVVLVSKAAGIPDQKLLAKDDPTAALINWGTKSYDPPGADRFSLFDVNGQITKFTAGVVTDEGTAVVTLSASGFRITTDPITGQHYIAGSDIAQAFDNALSPLVAGIGAGVILNGAELDFTFAPGSTSLSGGGIGGGEVDFGTTSVDGDITAGIDASAVPEPGGLVLFVTGLLCLLAKTRWGEKCRRE